MTVPALPPGDIPPPRKSLWAALTGPDPALLAQGLIATRTHRSGAGWLSWQYETPQNAERRADRFHDLRQITALRIALGQLLRVPPSTVRVRAEWPYNTPDSAPIRVELPPEWLGGSDARQEFSDVLRSRLGGKWETSWHQDHWPPYVTFTWKPPAKHPPAHVAWALSDDPWRLYLGETADGPYLLDIERRSPHWGVCALTGGGKTTALLLGIVHARLRLGALVDVVDCKEDSYVRSIGDGLPGVRIHKSAESAVMALAEFFVSMKAIATARRDGYPVETIPPRFLVFDEYGSFVLAADNWWKYGLQGKGPAPFVALTHMVLMQGRTKNHRVIVGTHQFSATLFKSTDARDLVVTKIVLGECSAPKWSTTFGLDTPRVKYDHNKVGRGAVGITGASSSVEEIQIAYIPDDEARAYLMATPNEHAWFDRGDMAPWVGQEAIALADREGYVSPFLPGGQWVTPGLSLVPRHNPLSLLPPSGPNPAIPTIDMPTLPDIVTLREAISSGILTGEYATLSKARTRDVKRSRFPTPTGQRGREKTYRASDLVEWEANR